MIEDFNTFCISFHSFRGLVVAVDMEFGIVAALFSMIGIFFFLFV